MIQFFLTKKVKFKMFFPPAENVIDLTPELSTPTPWKVAGNPK